MLFRRAREARDGIFPKLVEVRSVIEYANICRQECNYCGMSRYSGLKRYILSNEEVLRTPNLSIGTDAGSLCSKQESFFARDYFENLCLLLKRIKDAHKDLTLICSFGNLSRREFKRLKQSGVERYLLKFETSDADLYKKIKPSDTLRNRVAHILMAQEAGFQVSPGISPASRARPSIVLQTTCCL